MNLEGLGGPADQAEGLRCMEQAAKTDPNAMYSFGAVYVNELYGVRENHEIAAQLLGAASTAGQLNAQKLRAASTSKSISSTTASPH